MKSYKIPPKTSWSLVETDGFPSSKTSVRFRWAGACEAVATNRAASCVSTAMGQAAFRSSH